MAASDVQVGGDHYKQLAVEPWDAMKAWLTPEQWRGYLLGTAIKYLSRANATGPGKGGRVDVEKARHVLEKLLEEWPKDLDKRSGLEQASGTVLKSLQDEDWEQVRKPIRGVQCDF